VIGLLYGLAATAVGYAAITGWMFFIQASLIFLPERELHRTPADVGLEHEAVELRTADGVTLSAWFVPAPEPGPAPTVLFLHGNAGNISHRLDTIAFLHDLGAATLIIDYRGYGESDGTPSEAGLQRDARAAWSWLTTERGLGAEWIVLYGRSLGGAVAAWLAAEHRPAGLIMESTFTSLADLGAEIYPWLPVRLLLRHRFDARAALARVEAPTLVAHAREDELVPFDHARRLAEVSPPVIELVELDGGHNRVIGSTRGYRDRLAEFLATITPAAREADPTSG